MNMRTTAGEAATGFQMAPAGQYLLRDYSHDDPAALTELRGLLQAIITGHRFLIPGSLNRLITQWHADIHRAILAHNGDATGGNSDVHQTSSSGQP